MIFLVIDRETIPDGLVQLIGDLLEAQKEGCLPTREQLRTALGLNTAMSPDQQVRVANMSVQALYEAGSDSPRWSDFRKAVDIATARGGWAVGFDTMIKSIKSSFHNNIAQPTHS